MIVKGPGYKGGPGFIFPIFALCALVHSSAQYSNNNNNNNMNDALF